MGEKDVHDHVRNGIKNKQCNYFPVSLGSSNITKHGLLILSETT